MATSRVIIAEPPAVTPIKLPKYVSHVRDMSHAYVLCTFTVKLFEVKFIIELQTIGVNSILQSMQGFIIAILVSFVKSNLLQISEILPLSLSYL